MGNVYVDHEGNRYEECDDCWQVPSRHCCMWNWPNDADLTLVEEAPRSDSSSEGGRSDG